MFVGTVRNPSIRRSLNPKIFPRGKIIEYTACLATTPALAHGTGRCVDHLVMVR
jgi:hypothetical protein